MAPVLYPGNPLLQQSFEFALSIIAYCDELKQLRQYEMSKQLFKSGTSIHAQIREGQKPESTADFIHKFKIAEKEASETEGWLLLCKHSEGFPKSESLLLRLHPIQKMLNRSIMTAKGKAGAPKQS